MNSESINTRLVSIIITLWDYHDGSLLIASTINWYIWLALILPNVYRSKIVKQQSPSTVFLPTPSIYSSASYFYCRDWLFFFNHYFPNGLVLRQYSRVYKHKLIFFFLSFISYILINVTDTTISNKCILNSHRFFMSLMLGRTVSYLNKLHVLCM